MSQALLQVKELEKAFGETQVLRGLSFEVDRRNL